MTTVALCVAAAPAHAAKSCAEPGAEWERATPAEAGMDAAKLQEAMDYATTQESFAVRVYRHGCLVAEDRLAPVNRNQTFESWSMAKSVTSMIFGRAMTLGLISPDDPVGALLPEADAAHGKITMRDLLTMTSGLKWNGFRDYNIFTQQDRVRDALLLDPVHGPGSYFEYAQSTVALLAEAVGRSDGEDVQAFAQRELMDPLGIPAGAWRWERDRAGHVQGFYGVNMRADDFGRLGELLRRRGVWKGQRLLSRSYIRQALEPSANNGCYGWLIWLNAAAPCIGPTIGDRPVDQDREFPGLPADLYNFSGLFGQVVTTFPSQGIVVVRTGQDPNLVFAGGADWEQELYEKVLAAVTDQQIERTAPPASRDPAARPKDYGFQDALLEPGEYMEGGGPPPPLPPAGPRRVRAPQLSLARSRVTRSRRVRVLLSCPARWPGATPHVCEGTARLTGSRGKRPYSASAGETKALRFKLTKRRLRRLRRERTMPLAASATNSDETGGTFGREYVTVRASYRLRAR